MRVFGLGTRMLNSLSALGIVLAFLSFAVSLTPSLMVRTYLVQGALSGVCAALGYMFGVFLVWLWHYLELPQPKSFSAKGRFWIALAAFLGCLPFVWRAAAWQNSTRILWQMEPLESAEPFRLAGVALLTFLGALIFGRLFQLGCVSFSRWLGRVMPRRLSNFLGLLLTLAIVWSIGHGILVRRALDAADASFKTLDLAIEDDTPAPTDPSMTGSPASLVSWEGLGRQGRHFVASGPRASTIGEFWKSPAKDPVRVYVGMNNADSPETMADLALKELKRQRAFERSILVVIVPTGTGWVDPAAMDTLEYLHHGDVASVALQYSYLASWLSLLVEPEAGKEVSRTVFEAVYGYWKTLPKDKRPRLYLHGLSLGALNSQISTDLYDVVGDPFQGALWSGPPFRSQQWRSITDHRVPGSPEWLPRFRDGSIIRFANQDGISQDDGATWGPIRIIYLQYASDPVTFFDPASFRREPAWLREPRGPDVSGSFVWIPGVTMLQLAFDMAIGTTSPIGHGHVYAPEHYIDCWAALTDPPGIGAQEIARLKQALSSR